MTLSSNFNKHSLEWREVFELMLQRKEELTEQLIASNDDEVRGKIKMIDEILSLDTDEVVEEPQSIDY